MGSSTENLEEKQVISPSNNPPVQMAQLHFWRKILPASYDWIFGIGLCAIALFINLRHLGRPSIWFDEAFSVELSRQPLPVVWRLITGPEPNMELYYLLLHFWLSFVSLFGFHQTEFIVRFPSAIFAGLSTLVVFILARRFLDLPSALLATIIYLTNSLQLVYAQQARSYALQLLLICIGWYALFVALRSKEQNKRWWLVFSLSMALAVYAQLFSMIVLFAQAVASVGILLPNIKEHFRRAIWLAASFVCTFILIIPMVLISRQGSKTGWLPIPHLRDISSLFGTISGGNDIYRRLLLICCFLAVGLVVLSYILQRVPTLRDRVLTLFNMNEDSISFQQHYLWLAWGLLCWIIIPIAVSYIVSQKSTHIYAPRYLVVIVPPLCLLVGMSIKMLKGRAVQIVLAFEMIWLGYGLIHLQYASAEVENWRPPAQWLIQKDQKDDGLICFDNIQGCQISIEYYLHAYPTSDAHFTADSPGAFSWTVDGPALPGSSTYDAVNTTKIAAYVAKHPRFFYIVARLNGGTAPLAQQAESWLDSHYHLIDQTSTSVVTIRLYSVQP